MRTHYTWENMVYFLTPPTCHERGYRQSAKDGDGSLEGMAQLSREDGKSQLGRMLTSLGINVEKWLRSPFLEIGLRIPAQTFSGQEQTACLSRPEEKTHTQVKSYAGPPAEAQEDPFHAAVYSHFSGKCVACLSWGGEVQSTKVHPQQFPRCASLSFYCNWKRVNAFRNQGGFLQMVELYFYFLSSALQHLIFIGQELMQKKMEKDYPESFT